MGQCLVKGIEPTKLHTHNINVDTINDFELNKLPGQMFMFQMESKGRKAFVEALKKSCLAPEVLRLKVGSKVMFVKNNFEEGYANGTLGKVVKCSNFGPEVMLNSGKIIKPEKVTWVIENEGKIGASIQQYPLRLAWAITVHKSQGMSLDSVEVDLSKSFEKGMGYVALSRVRSLDGLKLVGLNNNALEVREDVLIFDDNLKEISHKNDIWLHSLSDKEIVAKQKEFIDKVAIYNEEEIKAKKTKKKKISTIDETKNMLEQKMGLKEIMEHKGVKIGTVLDHIEKIIEKDTDFDINHLKKEVSVAKYKKIWMTFRELYGENREYLLSPIKNKLGESYTFEELRIVRLFVKRNLN